MEDTNPLQPSTSRTSIKLGDELTPKLSRTSLHTVVSDADLHNVEEEKSRIRDESKKKVPKTTMMERFREFCIRVDLFATEHVWPMHVLCIVVASAIIPISAVAIIWDLLSAVAFEIPDLSTINTPAFVLFINFIAIPLAMYGYMMEYLMHEHSKLAIIALICVVVHPILFTTRAIIEYTFDGYRGEEKIYFEGFDREGQEQKYPIGIVRYRLGNPFSDSEEGQEIIKDTFENTNKAKGTVN